MSAVPERSKQIRQPSVIPSRSRAPIGIEYGVADVEKPAEAVRTASPSKIKPPSTYTRSVRASSTSTSKASPLPSTISRPPRSIATRPPISSSNSRPTSRRSKTPDAPTASSLQRNGSTSKPATRSMRGASVSTVPAAQNARIAISTHSRGKSVTIPTQSTNLRPPSSGSIVTNSSTSMLPPPRPTFTTLQQHFSPAKGAALAPKPASATFFAPPSPSKRPENVAISAETARLQAELLQLHLLHRDAAAVQRQWKQSARQKLGEKFEKLRAASEQLAIEEGEERRRMNLASWKEWKEDAAPGWGLAERVQVLDEVLTAVWRYSEPGSRYLRSVRKFEKWLDVVEESLIARQQVSMVGIELPILDGTWETECENMERKLSAWRTSMRDLGEVHGKSAVAATVNGCRSLVRGMHEQVCGMLRIEQQVVRQDREWTARMCDADSEGEDDRSLVTGGVWRL